MTTNTTQQGVLLFQQAFKPDSLPKVFKPNFVTGEVWQLCLYLIEEEWEELYDAKTIEERADAFADLHYVIHFAENCCGIDIQPIQDEVQRSNMTKGWTDEEIHSEKYDRSFMTATLIPNCTGPHRWAVHNEYGKTIKSPSYSPANIKPLIEAQLNGH